MKVLVINAGSSSCKYQLLEMDTETVLASGLAERIGQGMGKLTHKIAPDSDHEEKIVRESAFPTHVEAMELVISLLTDPEKGVIKDKSEIYAIGLPSVIMIAIGSVMTFGMNKILISFTEAATAVFGAYFKLQSFIFMPCFGLNNAMVPIVSYNYGAQKFDRVRKTVRLTVFTAIGIMCVGCALFELIPETLLGMFSPTDEMLSIGRVALRIIGVHFPLAGFSIIAGSACQALGKPIYALINSVCRQIVVLLPAAYLLSLTGRLELVWLAFPIAEVVSVILNATFLRLTYRASLERK